MPAVLAVASGMKVVASRVLTDMLEAAGLALATSRQCDGLTRREVETITLLASGLSYRQIAQRLRISQKTVGYHVSNTYGKLRIVDRSQATLYAVRKGLIQP